MGFDGEKRRKTQRNIQIRNDVVQIAKTHQPKIGFLVNPGLQESKHVTLKQRPDGSISIGSDRKLRIKSGFSKPQDKFMKLRDRNSGLSSDYTLQQNIMAQIVDKNRERGAQKQDLAKDTNIYSSYQPTATRHPSSTASLLNTSSNKLRVKKITQVVADGPGEGNFIDKQQSSFLKKNINLVADSQLRSQSTMQLSAGRRNGNQLSSISNTGAGTYYQLYDLDRSYKKGQMMSIGRPRKMRESEAAKVQISKTSLNQLHNSDVIQQSQGRSSANFASGGMAGTNRILNKSKCFNFDSHLSKQGSQNVKRYYKLKETINAKSQRLLVDQQKLSLSNLQSKVVDINEQPSIFSKVKRKKAEKSMPYIENYEGYADFQKTQGRFNDQIKSKNGEYLNKFYQKHSQSIPLKKQQLMETVAAMHSSPNDPDTERTDPVMSSLFNLKSTNVIKNSENQNQGASNHQKDKQGVRKPVINHKKQKKSLSTKFNQGTIQVPEKIQISDLNGGSIPQTNLPLTQKTTTMGNKNKIKTAQKSLVQRNENSGSKGRKLKSVSKDKVGGTSQKNSVDASQSSLIKKAPCRSPVLQEPSQKELPEATIDLKIQNTNFNQQPSAGFFGTNNLNRPSTSASPDEKQFFRTEDGQLMQADSDDEYIVMQNQINCFKKQGRNSISYTQMETNPKIKANAHFELLQPKEEYGFISENQLSNIKINQVDPGSSSNYSTIWSHDNIKKARKLLTNLKQSQRYQSHSTFKNTIHDTLNSRKSNRSKCEQLREGQAFKLATQMSKEVKNTNSSLNNVLGTLSMAVNMAQFKFNDTQLNTIDGQNIQDVDTSELLNNTNIAIKNLNYSLMKLVSVQQENQVISKSSYHSFVLQDRVSSFFEVNATGLPHPAKIHLRADPLVANKVPIDTLNQLIQDHTHIFISTHAKNPTDKNCQMQLHPPTPRSFTFVPTGILAQHLASDGQTMLAADQFDKIFIGLHYDLSAASLDSYIPQLLHLFKPGEKPEGQKLMDYVSQINVQIVVRFPKDKEEMQKKKMAALLRKLEATQGHRTDEGVEQDHQFVVSGADNGERKLEQINKQLSDFYDQQQILIFEAEQQKQLKARNNKSSSELPDLGFLLNTENELIGEEMVGGAGCSKKPTTHHETPPTSTTKLTQEIEKQLLSHHQNYQQQQRSQAYDFVSKEALGQVRYNQLLDMYAIHINQQLERSMQPQRVPMIVGPKDNVEEADNPDMHSDNYYSDPDEFDEMEAQDPLTAAGATTDDNFCLSEHKFGIQDKIEKAASGQLTGPIDHIARNAYISCKYRQINGIRSHLTRELTATRLQSTQEKAQINDLARRLKSQQWLNKWDQFRVQKRLQVTKALKILKARRRVKNLITIIVLAKFVKGIIENYELIKAYNMRKFMEFMIAVRLYVRFQRKFKDRYGQGFHYRQRNHIRRVYSFQTRGMYNQYYQNASQKVVYTLSRHLEKLKISQKFVQYYHKIRFIQISMSQVSQMSQIKDQMAVMRILQDIMTLKHLYMSLSNKNKVIQRISARLHNALEQINQEIKMKKQEEAEVAGTQGGQSVSKRVGSHFADPESFPLLHQLHQHMKLYDDIGSMKYKMRIMENVQNQYGLLHTYLEAEKDAGGTTVTQKDFDQVSNAMIETFKRQKEMAERIEKLEQELYGVDNEFMLQPVLSTKKEKKSEPKEYDLKQSYRHLNQVLQEVDEDTFHILKDASRVKKLYTQKDEQQELANNETEEIQKPQVQPQSPDKKLQKKKGKEKQEGSLAENISSEEHQGRLRADRKSTLKSIHLFCRLPEKKALQQNVNRLQRQKTEAFKNGFRPGGIRTSARKEYDKERIFILDEDDRNKYYFFQEFKDEVQERGYDQIAVYQRQYKRPDIFRIIFKVLRMWEYMAGEVKKTGLQD